MDGIKQAQIIEVGPRDGFQNIKEFIPTQLKLEIIEGLVKAGISAIELTSFINPKAIPQMQDAEDITKTIVRAYPHIRTFALVPNLRGAKNAAEAGLKEVTYVISASEAHNRANVKRSIEESMEGLRALRKELPDMKIRLDIATAFGCPFSGKVSEEKVLHMIGQAIDAGVEEIILCDTIGIANPEQVRGMMRKLYGQYKMHPFALHLHNTRGMGLANTVAALQEGLNTFETSLGGLGGCPFAPGAEGNTATEDMVNMLQGMEIETGIDLEQLLEVVRIIKSKVNAKITGAMVNACKYPLG